MNTNPLELASIAVHMFGAMQKPAELAGTLATLQSGNPVTMLEIGAGNGGTAWVWSKLPSLEKLIVLDLPNGPWGGTELDQKMEYIKQNSDVELVFIKGNSQNSEAKIAVLNQLGIDENIYVDGGYDEEDKLDILHIDGDHSYEGVKSDFLTYSPLVKKGGLVIFHDICEHAAETGCNVRKFWLELLETCPKENYVEFICEPTNWGGVGVIKL